MKLPCDQNLSPKLVNRLADLFPGSSHVQSVGLDGAEDVQVWEHARLNGLAIVSKDADYNNFSVLWGSPPKVIWLHSWATALPHKWRPCFVPVLPTSRRSRKTLL